MHFSIDSVVTNEATKPPRIVIYGDHGLGKTTFGASAPKPIFLRTEDGLAGLRVATFPKLAKSYSDVMAALTQLYTSAHDFQTLVIDSLDWLEPLVWAHTATLAGKDSIEDFGYGKGYTFADEHWRAIFDGLNALNEARGMTIILLAHAEVKRFDSPETEPYDRYQIKLHKRAAAMVSEWADVLGFVHFEVHTAKTDVGFNQKQTRGVGVGNRILSVEERPAYDAKNRFGLPADLPFPRIGAFNVFAQACAAAYASPESPAEAAPADASPAPAPAEEPEPAAAAVA